MLSSIACFSGSNWNRASRNKLTATTMPMISEAIVITASVAYLPMSASCSPRLSPTKAFNPA